ncbi:MAG TPA: hypothetical protein VE888_08600, partial [Streptosporangiaceae bacterium]|nr:hypothetical protein [Streptosporangiaceae bacterium]
MKQVSLGSPDISWLAVVIFPQKRWRYGKRFGQAVGVLLVATGCWRSGSRGCASWPARLRHA